MRVKQKKSMQTNKKTDFFGETFLFFNDKDIYKNNFFTPEKMKLITYYPYLIGKILGKDKLTELHNNWILNLFGVRKKYLSLMAHRGSYKTTTLQMGILWFLIFNPCKRIAYFKKTYKQSAEIIRNISTFFEFPEIKEMFRAFHLIEPKKEVDREDKILFNFKRTQTPEVSLTAHGLDFGITGKHYDLIILDDFVTLKDRISKAERERTKEVVREIITNVADPQSRIIFVGTPWHKNDCWSIIDSEVFLRYNIYDTKILTEEEIEEKRKTTTPYLFSINYLLEFTSEEDKIFKEAKYKSWNFENKNVYGHIDCAYGGTHYNALTFIQKNNENEYIVIGFVKQGHLKDLTDWILSKIAVYRPHCIYVERNADKGFGADLLRNLGLSVRDYDEKQNKKDKILNYLYNFWKDLYFDYQTDDEYLEQILDYVGEEPDDAPDSLASLLREHFYKKTGSITLYQ